MPKGQMLPCLFVYGLSVAASAHSGSWVMVKGTCSTKLKIVAAWPFLEEAWDHDLGGLFYPFMALDRWQAPLFLSPLYGQTHCLAGLHFKSPGFLQGSAESVRTPQLLYPCCVKTPELTPGPCIWSKPMEPTMMPTPVTALTFKSLFVLASEHLSFKFSWILNFLLYFILYCICS